MRRADELDRLLVMEWGTTKTLEEIGQMFDMSGSSVRTVFRRLAKAGRVPSVERPHVDRALDREEIRIGEDDPLLARLRRAHPEGGG